MKEQILSRLPAYPWADRFHYFDSIHSTSDHIRTLAKAGAPHGTVVMADHQTAGHGRRGRSFHSPEGMGVYLSILLRPQCAPQELMHLTCATGTVMCDALEYALGLRPGIKWTNDLVWDQRKLGGILTELGFSPKGTLEYCIIGIGINCCQKEIHFPEDIRSIAGSLAMAAGTNVDRCLVAAAMLEALVDLDRRLLPEKAVLMDRYRRDCITLGREILLLRGDERRYGTALDMDDNGALIVKFSDGTAETVNSGEVSIRGMYGYV